MFPTPFFLLYKRLYSGLLNILFQGSNNMGPRSRVKCLGLADSLFKDPKMYQNFNIGLTQKNLYFCQLSVSFYGIPDTQMGHLGSKSGSPRAHKHKKASKKLTES